MSNGTTNIMELNEKVLVDKDNIHELVSGLQQVSKTGITQLSSRDISMSTENHTQDLESIPTHVPQQYYQQRQEEAYDSHDDDYMLPVKTFYDEFQMPLFISVLYFVFQLPFYKKYVLLLFPAFAAPDKSFNLFGYLFSSFLFSFIFFLINKLQ